MLAALLLAGCGGGSGKLVFENPPPVDGTPQRGGTLTVGAVDDVGSWDALVGFESLTSLTLHPLVTEGLAKPAPDFRSAIPALAERIEHNPQYTEWTATLRPGARFSDGRPVTASDVVFSFARVAAHPQWSYLLGPYKRAVAVDRRTVRFVLSAPDAEFALTALATNQTGIVPADFGGVSEAEFARRPIGAGPFEVADWEPGQSVDLRRNPHYWDPRRPLLDEVAVEVQSDDNARLLALQSGQIQVAHQLAAGAQARATDDILIRGVRPSAVTDVLFLAANVNPLLADVDVRRAISYAIDRRTLALGVYRESAQPALGLIPPGTYGWSPSPIKPTYDLERARSLMARSDHPAGGRLAITHMIEDQIAGVAAKAIADQLSKIGIDVDVREISFAEFSEVANSPSSDLQAVMFKYQAAVIPAGDVLGYFAATKGFNGGYPVGPTAKVYAELQQTSSEAEAKRLVRGWEKYFARNAFAIPVAQPYWIIGQRLEVQDLRVAPIGTLSLDTAWIAG